MSEQTPDMPLEEKLARAALGGLAPYYGTEYVDVVTLDGNDSWRSLVILSRPGEGPIGLLSITLIQDPQTASRGAAFKVGEALNDFEVLRAMLRGVRVLTRKRGLMLMVVGVNRSLRRRFVDLGAEESEEGILLIPDDEGCSL